MRLLKLWLPVIVWTIVILWASNDTFSSSQSRGWLSLLVGQEVAEGVNIAIRKLGHVVAYGILGALTWRADRRVAIGMVLVLGVAVTDEWRQSLTLSRTGTPWDVLLDLVGGWVGIVAAKKVWRPGVTAS
jgi:VanZ family protein